MAASIDSFLKSTALFAAGLAFLAPCRANGGPLLDYLRNYDLNDYALGVALSTSQNPYVGSGNATYAYPYLTSFRHSALTDDWLLILGENLGFRFITDNDWEFGVIGRIQTLGFGVSETEALDGIDDRRWALETGPLVGWRGSPIHVQFRAYWEAPNRHDGMSGEIEVSLPRETDHGFFVPGIKLSYMTAAYADYYFGVAADEATATRPQYHPGEVLNVWTGFSLGHALSPRWLLKASVGVEFLDTAVSDSPIIERDRSWAGSIGLAYNANLFQPRDYVSRDNQQDITFRVAALRNRISTTVSRDASTGQAGNEVDLEDFLGVADRETVMQYDALVRVGFYHRFDVSYFELARHSGTTLQRDVMFGDTLFPAGTDVDTGIDTQLWRLAYSYSLMRDGQKELGVSAGLSYAKIETSLQSAAALQVERVRIETPLPTIGVFGSVALGETWRLGADIQAFALEFDRYKGYLGYANLDLDRLFGERLAIGIGYSYYGIRLKSRDEDLRGKFSMQHYGPKLYLALGF